MICFSLEQGEDALVEVCLVGLRDYSGRWVIGTAPAVKKSNRGSSHIQMKYHDYHRKTSFRPSSETYHKHTGSVEEYYLVLRGKPKMMIEGRYYRAQAREILIVPPGKCHCIVTCSGNAEYLTIRAPISDDSKKQEC